MIQFEINEKYYHMMKNERKSMNKNNKIFSVEKFSIKKIFLESTILSVINHILQTTCDILYSFFYIAL